MLSLSDYFLRWNGRKEWLTKKINGLQISMAPAENRSRHLQNMPTVGISSNSHHGLPITADYNFAGMCQHHILDSCQLNAQVFNLRLWPIYSTFPVSRRQPEYRAEAATLLTEVQKLYKSGAGFWHARFRTENGRVRHCYDFFTTINTIGDDLDSRTKSRNVRFFNEELQD
jgi:hypothetical protein